MTADKEDGGLLAAREAFLNLIADAIKWEEHVDEGGFYYTLETTGDSLVPLLNALGIEQQRTTMFVDEVGPLSGLETPADAISRAIEGAAA